MAQLHNNQGMSGTSVRDRFSSVSYLLCCEDTTLSTAYTVNTSAIVLAVAQMQLEEMLWRTIDIQSIV